MLYVVPGTWYYLSCSYEAVSTGKTAAKIAIDAVYLVVCE